MKDLAMYMPTFDNMLGVRIAPFVRRTPVLTSS